MNLNITFKKSLKYIMSLFKKTYEEKLKTIKNNLKYKSNMLKMMI